MVALVSFIAAAAVALRGATVEGWIGRRYRHALRFRITDRQLNGVENALFFVWFLVAVVLIGTYA